nr:hypothetical protein [Shewanella amazonensis]
MNNLLTAGVVAQGASELSNNPVDGIVGYLTTAPHFPDKLVATDGTTGTLQQTHQYLHHPQFEFGVRAVFGNHTPLWDNHVGAEAVFFIIKHAVRFVTQSLFLCYLINIGEGVEAKNQESLL